MPQVVRGMGRKNMNRVDLEGLERRLRAEVERRQHLGGYNSDAECLMLLTEAMYKITQHLREWALAEEIVRTSKKK